MKDTSEKGFTVVELLAVMALGAILATLGAGALRDYTRGKALQGARDMTVTALRAAQQRTFSEGYPKAYGIRFLKGGTRWELVRYDASTDTCAVVQSSLLSDGVTISTSSDFADSGTASGRCRDAAPNASGNYEVALFYARGSSTSGSVTFSLTGTAKTRTVSVNGVTGRAS